MARIAASFHKPIECPDKSEVVSSTFKIKQVGLIVPHWVKVSIYFVNNLGNFIPASQLFVQQQTGNNYGKWVIFPLLSKQWDIRRETGECITKYEMIGLCGGLQSLAPLERSYESDARRLWSHTEHENRFALLILPKVWLLIFVQPFYSSWNE